MYDCISIFQLKYDANGDSPKLSLCSYDFTIRGTWKIDIEVGAKGINLSLMR